jgi:hypothetical protein
MDLTFKNDLIKKYFDGDDSYVPTGELMYLHKHPLVTPNFLTEINELVVKTGELMIKKNMEGYPVTKFEDLAIRLGAGLPDITPDSAQKSLEILRELYAFCNKLTGTLQ